MDIESLIDITTARVPLKEELEAVAQSTTLSEADVLDRVSVAIATRFAAGVLAFDDADTAMNNLVGYAAVVHTYILPDLAWRVYLAFDDGEYEHPADPPELQGANRTLAQLATIPELNLAPVHPNPSWRDQHASRKRAEAVAIADQVISGDLSPILGARALLLLQPALGVPSGDDDFDTFVVIESETDALPLGAVRSHWAPEALAAKELEIQRAEEWAMAAGGQAFRNVRTRFRESA